MTLIDTTLAALMLRCTPRWVRHLVQQGIFANYGTARQILLDVDQVADEAARRML